MEKELKIASSITEAVKLVKEKGCYLAGGTEVNRLNSSVKASRLVSIKKLGLNKIESTRIADSDGKKREFICIGSCCTFQQIIEDSLSPVYLKDACHFMTSRTKRNMATIGGNIALLRDDSYLCATLLASGARIQFSTGKIIGLDEFLEKNEKYRDRLITCVYVKPKAKVLSKRFANTAESRAYLTVSVCYLKRKTYSMYSAIMNTGLVKIGEDISSIKFKDDLFASSEYKKYLLETALDDLCTRAKEVNYED